MSLIFFDLAGVLLSNGSRQLIAALSCGDRVRAAQLAGVLGGGDAWALRRGEIDDDTFWSRNGGRLSAVTGLAAHEIRRHWLEQFVPQAGVERLVDKLSRAGHVLGAIAELTPERAAFFDRSYPFLAKLTRRYYSFELGADKRDGRLFRLAAADLLREDCAPLVFEDEPAAAAQAERAGFRSCLWTTAQAAEAIIDRQARGPRHGPVR